MRLRALGLLIALATVVVVVAVVVVISGDGNRDEARAAPLGGLVAAVDCGGGGPSRVKQPVGSVGLGDLVLIGASHAASRPPDAFGGHGYKIAVSLPEGAAATVSVPPALRSRVGLVFSLETQSRVLERGVRAADSATSFTACPGDGEPGRTGWPGGFVVDRPRCAALIVRVPGEAPTRHRVPLGRPC